MSEPRDLRLFCYCGEIGELKPGDGGGFRVFCRREGRPCCMSREYPTAEAALSGWAELNESVEARFPKDVSDEQPSKSGASR